MHLTASIEDVLRPAP